jgi:cyclase
MRSRTRVHHPERAEVAPAAAFGSVQPSRAAMICTTSTNNSVALDAGLRQHIVSGTSGSGSSSRVRRTRVRTVINTHHHGDHTYGNYLFPGATIISHELCRRAVLDDKLDTTEWFPGVQWGDLQISPPTVTFEDSISVWCNDLRAIVKYVGPAHTSNDVIVWVPDRGLLYAGDLVFNGGTPFVLMGSVQGLIEALTELEKLGATTVVPGHGPVGGPETITDQIAYLRFVQELAAQGLRHGRQPLEVAQATALGRFADLTDPERLVGNLHRAYSELRDEPRGVALDYGAIIDEMITYNGGRPLRCLA